MILFCALTAVGFFVLALILENTYNYDLSFGFTIGCLVMMLAMIVGIAADCAQPLPKKTEAMVQLGPAVKIEALRLMPKGARTFFEWPFLGTSIEYRLYVGGADQVVTEDDAKKMLFEKGPAGKDMLWRMQHMPASH